MIPIIGIILVEVQITVIFTQSPRYHVGTSPIIILLGVDINCDTARTKYILLLLFSEKQPCTRNRTRLPVERAL